MRTPIWTYIVRKMHKGPLVRCASNVMAYIYVDSNACYLINAFFIGQFILQYPMINCVDNKEHDQTAQMIRFFSHCNQPTKI